MKILSLISLALLASGLLQAADVEQPDPAASAGVPRESPKGMDLRASALVAKVYCVTVLQFETDRPVQEARVIVDGKVIKSDTLTVENHTGLKVAAVVSRPEKRATIYLDTPQYATHFQVPYQPSMDARIGRPEERYGPGKNLKLSGTDWVEIYRYTDSFFGAGNPVYELKLEIR